MNIFEEKTDSELLSYFSDYQKLCSLDKYVADHGLTGEQAQAIGMEYAKANFPGHQALVCTHTDGSNNSGNIHTHIIINSLRKEDIASQLYTERAIDCKAGYKHHLTKEYLRHLQGSLMDMRP